METMNDKTVDVLNELVVINNDRIEGYEKAAEETKDPELKDIFHRFMSQSQKFKQELAQNVQQLGGEVKTGTKASGKLYRAFMDVKAALTGNDRKTVLDSCERGEDVALEHYKDALQSDAHLSPEVRQIVERQRDELQKSHDVVKRMRDSAKN
jgi:uncharacterized protein (TIGR02284 family)